MLFLYYDMGTGFYKFSLSILFLSCFFISAAQAPKDKIKCDSLFVLSEKQFADVVNHSLQLLQTKKMSEITADQHRTMIRAYNTIRMSNVQKPAYAKGNYAKLEALMGNRGYSRKLLKIYPGWSPNRGMGMYFYKLDIEYGGTPCPSSIITVK